MLAILQVLVIVHEISSTKFNITTKQKQCVNSPPIKQKADLFKFTMFFCKLVRNLHPTRKSLNSYYFVNGSSPTFFACHHLFILLFLRRKKFQKMYKKWMCNSTLPVLALPP